MMPDREYVEMAVESGEAKLHLLVSDPARYLVRSVMAGMYLSIVVFIYWSLLQNAATSPFGKVAASGFFGVGLTMIVFTNAELFTSNNLYLAISSYEGHTTWRDTMILWIVCYLGNLGGALVIGALLSASGLLGELPANHALFSGAAHKVQEAPLALFTRGILANWVVCLAVRIALRCQNEVAKILVLLLVVFMFLYFGGEHSIANMGTFAMALIGSDAITIPEALYNLVFSTAGNIVGGVLLVALPFAYVNPSDKLEAKLGTERP